MKRLNIYEEISCDMCGQAMSTDSSKMFIEGQYLGDRYVTEIVDLSVVYSGTEFKCLCHDCKKKILETAIGRL